jgi:type IV secretory pathway VirB10-like protein
MERFPVELLYALAIVGFFLFNMLAQRAARRRQREEQAAQPEPVVAEEPLEDVWGRTPQPAPVLAPMEPAPPPPPPRVSTAPRRMHPMRALLNDPRDLRRAVALMMVLGPCRAQEPPDR